MQRSRGPVDEVDREIIRLLQRDGRTSNTDIARALEVTETTIRKRIARLIDETWSTWWRCRPRGRWG